MNTPSDPRPAPDARRIPITPRARSGFPDSGTDQSPVPPQVAGIQLPTSGGAIRSIGERFSVNPVTGTASFSVPIATSPGRSGFGPQLGLSYDSGLGNGPFGLGWALSAPMITRKTQRGVPRYTDEDTFVLAGAEDLVPAAESAGPDVTWGGHTYHRTRFTPQLESAYARIERWENPAEPADSIWRVVSSSNVTSWFGLDDRARVSDPDEPGHVFQWLLSVIHDDKGNVSTYEYLPEDSNGVDESDPHERHRTAESRAAMRYLKSIRYGNTTPWYPTLDPAARTELPKEWLFQVVFDYGDHCYDAPAAQPSRTWPVRPDPFSRYRSGFELRTYRRCQRVLMFHNFPAEPEVGPDCLVHATELSYTQAQGSSYSLLRAITGSGYRRRAGSSTSKSLPPLEFSYSEPRIDDTLRKVDAPGLPDGVDGSRHRWADLDGDGAPGVLGHYSGAWWYSRNLSPGAGRAVLAQPEPVALQPSGAAPGGRQFLADLAGDGSLDLVELTDPAPGVCERTDSQGWSPLVPFRSLPRLDWADPALRFVDLTGDGLPDVLITRGEELIWHPSLGEDGFGPAQRTAVGVDDERGPRVVFTGDAESILLADMSGDGLDDLVRVKVSEVCYWPNLGHGRFGPKVVMTTCPLGVADVDFDPRRVLLADIDGSGTADLLYLGTEGISVHVNRSGNGFAPPILLRAFGGVADPQHIAAVDLLGSGTACLVRSSPLPADAPLAYLDLMVEGKPHLLVRQVNNLGGETVIEYAPSTAFSRRDAEAGRPWTSRLPFPVQVVERTEVLDHIQGTRLTTRYAYHHGRFDGVEREFAGFALVETQDTDYFDVGGAVAQEHHQPPVTTLTWYHTGTATSHAAQYHQGRGLLAQPEMPANMAPGEEHQCLRALRGVPLHREVFSYDGSPVQHLPFSIEEHRHRVRRLQPPVGDVPGVYQVDTLESVTQRWERSAVDHRVAASFNLEHDPYGRATKVATVAYGRAVPDPSLPPEIQSEQARTTITYCELDQTPDIYVEGQRPAYRLRVPFATRAFEITGIAPKTEYFGFAELADAIAATAPLDYEVTADGTPQRRLVSERRSDFRSDALVRLPFGQWDTLGLRHQDYALAHTAGTLAAYPAGSVTDADLTAGGFVQLEGDPRWWAPGGTVVFGPDPNAHFYLPTGARDPLGVQTIQRYDKYDLLVEQVSCVQATWNTTVAANDYRVLGPWRKTDPNGNSSAVAFDELGMITAQATMGKPGSGEGDTLDDPSSTFEYELHSYAARGVPAWVHVRTRETHGDPATRWIERYAYSDGGGGIALVKERVAPGPALQVQPDGSAVSVIADPRWRASGRVVLDNKGSPIRSYDPYFSDTSDYEDADSVRSIGVSAVNYYDSAGRLIRTEFPEGTLSRTEYLPWSQRAFDANDTVLDSRWYIERGSPDPLTEPEPVDPQRRAAWLAAQHADTPGTAHFDVLGNTVYAVSDAGEGNLTAVRIWTDFGGRSTILYDQLGRETCRTFSGFGTRAIWTESAERGRQYVLTDVTGAILRNWDSHGRVLRAEYDAIRRPVGAYARQGEDPEILLSYVVYGDRHPQAVARNLCGTPHLVFDQAGVVRVPALDFHGAPPLAQRQLATAVEDAVDWSPLTLPATVAEVEAIAADLLEAETFSVQTQLNALHHPTRVVMPDDTVIRAEYDESATLAAIWVQPGGAGTAVQVLQVQQRDIYGRRLAALVGNGLTSKYKYDPLTERLTSVTTSAPGAAGALQALGYVYDPVGNVVSVDDTAQQTLFFNNAVVTPEARYTYDALYQLTSATGRELAGGLNDAVRTGADLDVTALLPVPNDTYAVRRYTQTYSYDAVGNILSIAHRFPNQAGVGAGWTRNFRYRYQDDPSDLTNRLASTAADEGPFCDTYHHDLYGNMTQLPGGLDLSWNLLDQLSSVDLGGGGRVHYRYGAGGQRVRRVVRRPGGLVIDHITLGPYEVRRERLADDPIRLEHQVVRIVDDGGPLGQWETKTIDTTNAIPATPLGVPVVSYRFGNATGSVTLWTDAAGLAISYEEFHPFGTSAYRYAKPGVNHTLKQHRYAGKHHDEETGFYCFGARYYAPWLGRWVSSDPAGLSGGGNLYRYCGNNPIGRTDPGGTEDKPLNPAGEVSWVVPPWVYSEGGKLLSDDAAKQNFAKWMGETRPDRPFTPGSVTIDWTSLRPSSVGPGGARIPGRGPKFNAEWINPSTNRPLLPRVGEFGLVAPQKDQPKAEYSDPATKTGRLTENEHNTPGAQEKLADPTYSKNDHRNAPSTRNPRGVALDKTKGDNARTAQLKANNQPINIFEEDLASHDRFQAANERARAAGQPHIDNPGSITRGTLEQMGARFDRGSRQQLPAGAAVEEPHIAPNNASQAPPANRAAPAPAAPSPARGGGGFTPAAVNCGGGFALNATRTIVPGVVEAEVGFATGSVYAYANGYATAGIALETAAAYTPVVGGSLMAGATGGNLAEAAMAKATSNRDAQVAAGIIGAAATGAAVGALIGSVVPIAGTVIGAGTGAAVGAVCGLAGYAISKIW